MTHPTCAVCGREADDGDHVRLDVERVPPERPPETYYFHPRCFDRAQDPLAPLSEQRDRERLLRRVYAPARRGGLLRRLAIWRPVRGVAVSCSHQKYDTAF